MIRKPTFQDRLRYHFDNYMSRGTGALIGGLALVSLLLILAATIVIILIGLRQAGEQESLSFGEALWQTMLHSIDTGALGGDSSWGMRLVMFFVTLGGIFVLSALISVLSSGLELRLDELRKGRSRVIESGHTIILGWSPQIFPILEELVSAYKSKGKTCIAILADKDKVDMEDEIRDRIGKPRNFTIVCRNGNPMDLNDLEIVNPTESKAIIVLASNWQYHDAEVIKTSLALVNNPNRRAEPYHIVGSLRNPNSIEVAQLITSSGEMILFQVNELIARITAQTCRQSGLSLVYEELLDLEGDKIFFKSEEGLTGKMYGEILSCYKESAVMGLAQEGGRILLNPNMETRLEADDTIIIVSREEPELTLLDKVEQQVAPEAIQYLPQAPREPESTLILGWNVRGARIVESLDAYVLPGSEVCVVSDFEDIEPQITALANSLVNQTISYQRRNIFLRSVLEALNVQSYDHIILLSNESLGDIQRADSITMVTLLHLRDIATRLNRSFPIVSEIIDIRNRDLIQVANVDDFIISDRIISLSLSQLAVERRVRGVFIELLNPEGTEIYLKPVTEYIRVDHPVNFYTIVESARRREETALGYRILSEGREAAKRFGVHLNPDKSKEITFSPDDRIIVVAEKQ